jgi:hypothetical protein
LEGAGRQAPCENVATDGPTIPWLVNKFTSVTRYTAVMATTSTLARFCAGLALSGASALAIGAAESEPVQQRERPTNQQRVYLSAVDKKGAPVTSTLAITDFTVREDGVSREILKVEPATDPMQIAVLIDTSAAITPSVSDIRLATKAFGAAIWAKSPDTEIALYSFGERPALETDFSTSPTNFNRRVDRLFGASGSGAYLIDAIIDASAALRKRKATRPVIVAYVDENGPEFSNRRHDKVFDALAAARASLWVISRQGFSSGAVETPENRERGIVIGDVTARTGGRNSTVFDGTAIKLRMTELASQLLSQFALTYGRPDTLVPPEKLEIRSVNDDVKLAAPRWTTR